MFCKRSLGSNEVIESFPVGRRLAFDAARGRLWVVCMKCRRRVASAILPVINGAGGSRRNVQKAVGRIEDAGHPVSRSAGASSR